MTIKHKSYFRLFVIYYLITRVYLSQLLLALALLSKKATAMRITVQGIDYEKADIDITEYSHRIVIGTLLFTCPEKNAYGIYNGCVYICRIFK